MIRKELLKEADTYFVVVPLLAVLWAVVAGLVFYPGSVQAWQDQQARFEESEKQIVNILQIEPERLAYKEQKGKSGDFDYTVEMDTFTKVCGISSGNYTLTVHGTLSQRGKKRKSADVSIKQTDIETLAKFISTLLIRWPDLECEQLTLDKVPGAKNQWKVKLRFTYYY